MSAAIQLFGRPCPEKRPWTKTIAAGLDMSAVLDVVGRPVALSGHIVSLVEQRIEGLEDKRFVLRLLGPTHILLQIPGCGS